MAYKYKSKKKDFTEREREELFKYAKHHKPTILQYLREADRDVAKVPKLLHTKGTQILYKENLGKITKVTNRGVWIEYYSCKDGFIDMCDKKKVFVTEKEIYGGKIYPLVVAHQPAFFGGAIITARP